MASFFSRGFGSGGSPTKKGKKGKKEEEEGIRVQIVDSRGQIVNCCCCQHSKTGFYYYSPPMQPVVGGAFLVPHMVQQAQPIAQQVVLQPAPTTMHCTCTKKKNKGKENEAYFWESFRDGKGRRFYKNSLTDEISYTDPLR